MNSAKSIIIGTRKSTLALAQSKEIKDLICDRSSLYQNEPELISIKGFQTTGDNILDKNLSDIGGKGLFTKEIEDALLLNKISLAAHSIKDMPATFPDGLIIRSILKREDPRDVFISKKYNSIEELPQNAIVGTSSTRRKAMLLAIRPDLKIVNFRGNVTTRLKKIDNDEVDATILALSGLRRINMEHYIKSIIPITTILPAIGQGAIGVQCRNDDQYCCDLLDKINDQDTAICISAERAFLQEIDGSCKTPIAAYCQIIDNQLFLQTAVCSPDGQKIYQCQRKASLSEAQKIGQDAAIETKINAQDIVSLFSK